MATEPSSGPQPAPAASSQSSTDASSSGSSPADAGIALAETIRSTLGPNGMDKMLVGSDGRVVVTNDGASILGRLEITDPIGKLLETTLETQRRAVSDGTTTTLVLIGELLSAAQSLQEDGVHPTTIIEGYAQATRSARQQLTEYAHPVDSTDEETLQEVAATTVTGRWDDRSTDRFASLAAAALRAVDFDRRRLTIAAYSGGELRDSQVIDGLLVDLDSSSTSIDSLDAHPVRSVSDPRLVLVDSELAVETPDSVESVSISDPEQAQAFRQHDQQVRNGVVRRLREVDADVVVCQKSIDSELRAELVGAGILAVERTRQDEFDAIARSTGATAIRSVDELTPSSVGRAGSVRRREIGSTDTLVITDCPNASPVSLLLRGGTPHVASETERIMKTCTTVVQRACEGRAVVPGGGATAMAVARNLSDHAEAVADREGIVIGAFADALEGIPRVLARNAGADPIDTLAALRTRHHAGATTVGVDRSGEPRDMVEAGVVEPRAVVDQTLTTTLEATAMCLRVDDTISASDSSAAETEHSHTEHGCDHESHTGGYPWALSH